MASFTMGIGMANLGWKFYMVNACYDILFLIGVWFFWVETKGLSLEAVGLKFEEIDGLMLNSANGSAILVTNNDSKRPEVREGSGSV
jgi:formate hydrogenlyase subunit 3/multisubunit Na+/H+ antiporter MnhD subunit